MPRKLLLALSLAACGTLGLALANSTATPPAAPQARLAALASKAPLLHATRAGGRIVAVGEYGHILISNDEGGNWRQAALVPSTTTLTAVHFVDPQHGWAVGHGGVILASSDGGEHWRIQQGQDDGAETLFSVWFRDARQGYAVGAYGYALATEDGGEHWEPLTIAEGEAGEKHLNQIFPGPGHSLLITAEAGTLFRSDDQGRHWQAQTLPYNGSLWGGSTLSNGDILLWGMRGKVLRSSDGGKTWSQPESGTDQSLTAALQRRDGSLALVGLGGALVRGDGQHFKAAIRPERNTAAAVLEGPDNSLILFGLNGVETLSAPTLNSLN